MLPSLPACVTTRNLFPLPSVTVVEADVYDAGALVDWLRHDAVINLVGVLNGDFERAHVTLTQNAIAAARAADVSRYLHYERARRVRKRPQPVPADQGQGEAAVRASGLDYTIFAPSVIFGRGDSFPNKFAAMVACCRRSCRWHCLAHRRASSRWVDDGTCPL